MHFSEMLVLLALMCGCGDSHLAPVDDAAPAGRDTGTDAAGTDADASDAGGDGGVAECPPGTHALESTSLCVADDALAPCLLEDSNVAYYHYFEEADPLDPRPRSDVQYRSGDEGQEWSSSLELDALAPISIRVDVSTESGTSFLLRFTVREVPGGFLEPRVYDAIPGPSSMDGLPEIEVAALSHTCPLGAVRVSIIDFSTDSGGLTDVLMSFEAMCPDGGIAAGCLHYGPTLGRRYVTERL